MGNQIENAVSFLIQVDREVLKQIAKQHPEALTTVQEKISEALGEAPVKTRSIIKTYIEFDITLIPVNKLVDLQRLLGELERLHVVDVEIQGDDDESLIVFYREGVYDNNALVISMALQRFVDDGVIEDYSYREVVR